MSFPIAARDSGSSSSAFKDEPRITRDIEGFRSFLIYENTIVQEEFLKMNKVVITNYYSMNGDVAQLIMDKDTTRQLGAVITIDHYVSTPEKLAIDVHRMAEGSGGKVVLGEFGAPIPDIHGDMTEQTQADWVEPRYAVVVGAESEPVPVRVNPFDE
jgi:hypothetical protein